jgi:hypothetical protein
MMLFDLSSWVTEATGASPLRHPNYVMVARLNMVGAKRSTVSTCLHQVLDRAIDAW